MHKICYNLCINGGYGMTKYKFRLSYKDGNKYIPINLDNVAFINEENKTEIKAIDEFTTNFECYEEMLNYLKNNSLISESVDKLYVTFDVEKNNRTYEQLYAYNKTLFFKNDIERLKGSYVFKYIRNRFDNGAFLYNIIKHYEKKIPNQKFSTFKSLVMTIKEGSLWSLDPCDRYVYSKEFNRYLDFLFTSKKKNEERKIVYKNIRDFLCYIDGEEPIKVKGNEIYETVLPKNTIEEVEDYIEPDNITLEEYIKFNKELVLNVDDFEAYRDGNDFIAPITQEEIEESLNDYAKKLCKKRDNGEYE